FIVILVYDQLLFRPLIASADWFRLEQEAGLTPSQSWALTMMRRSHVLGLVGRLFVGVLNIGGKSRSVMMRPRTAHSANPARRLGDFTWYAVIVLIGLVALLKAVRFVFAEVSPAEV